MSATIPGLSVMGDFILLPTGTTALSVRHISVIHLEGREDPDRPQARDVQLNADVETEGGGGSFVLGRFRTFLEAKDALEHLLALIGHQDDDVAEVTR